MPLPSILALIALNAAALPDAPRVAVAWFTDAPVHGAVASVTPSPLPPMVAGTCRRGVRADGGVAVANPLLRRGEGLISFWVRPRWSGADRVRRTLLRVGDPASNGLVVEKSEAGLLRFVMAGGGKRTAARADIRGWRPGVWRHVAVGWFSRGGAPLGLPLWIDRVAVDGPIAGGNPFFDPEAMADRSVRLGGPGSECDIDEMVMRDRIDAYGSGMVGTVYRDALLTGPCAAIRVNPTPMLTPADARVVAGGLKQLGLEVRTDRGWQPVTEHSVRYGPWADFDMKPHIRWSSSNAAVATVDAKGCVRGVAPGSCRIGAEFRGMRADWTARVISAARPDLGLICIEMLPRYRSDAAKDRPAPGDAVTAVVRYGNFGAADLPAGARVRLDLVEDGGSYRFEPARRRTARFEAATREPLAPGQEGSVEFRFAYPERPLWMHVALDPANAVDEICEANNDEAERTDARPIQMGYAPKALQACLRDRSMNHVGSYSYYDWLRAEKRRMDVMLREAVWPTTGPHGVEELYRIDRMTPLQGGPWDDEPFNRDAALFDGGFPVNEPVDLMAIDPAIIHEFGHTILSQPDLYGYPIKASNVFVTGGDGKRAAGTPLLPIVGSGGTLSASHAFDIPCGGGYTSLMNYCHLWLHPSQAGHIMHYKGYRGDRFWGTQGRLIPTRSNALAVTDIGDRPLAGATVRVYHVVNPAVQDSGAKYIPDLPKFVGPTDADGRFVFPGATDARWDDAETDEVEGEMPVWNPFGRAKQSDGGLPDTAFTPNVWTVEGLLLLQITSGAETEYRWMDLTEVNEAYLSGRTVAGRYDIRTSLRPSATPTEVRIHAEEPAKQNLRPVAVAPAEVRVQCGQSFEIDLSASHDPEGKPLTLGFTVEGEWLRMEEADGLHVRLRAPEKAGVRTYRFWVIDGLRYSLPISVKVVAKAAPQP
jgi:hypothetical protein